VVAVVVFIALLEPAVIPVMILEAARAGGAVGFKFIPVVVSLGTLGRMPSIS
jgi:hypothetical protein